MQLLFPSVDCKYKFGPWGACDTDTNTKSRSGTLKRALFNAECQDIVTVSKPCPPKVKKTRGEEEAVGRVLLVHKHIDEERNINIVIFTSSIEVL